MAFLPALATIATVVGTVATIGATVIGMKTAKEQGQYQAAVANNNKVISTQNAVAASDQAQKSQQDSDMQTNAMIGEQLSVQAASGLDVNSASMLRTRETANKLGQQDAQRIREEGSTNIRGYLQQAENYSAEASAAKAGAAGSMLGTFFSGVGSLVSNASRTGSPIWGQAPTVGAGTANYGLRGSLS